MLIRSQDKSRIRPLSSCLEIYVRDCYVRIDGADYGEYSTKEKAIKVMDMICDFYAEHIEEICNDPNPFIRAVFYMPQDDDVI